MPEPRDPAAGDADAVDPFALTCAELVELVTGYVEGTLSADERARIDAHLTVCPPCVHVIEQWRRVIELAGQIDEDDVDRLPTEQRALLMTAFARASGR